jgi:hypothetical protein
MPATGTIEELKKPGKPGFFFVHCGSRHRMTGCMITCAQTGFRPGAASMTRGIPGRLCALVFCVLPLVACAATSRVITGIFTANDNKSGRGLAIYVPSQSPQQTAHSPR